MRYLSDCKENIHSCSKCGLCQSVCPIYKITGNDCTVSRGHFIMLRGLLKGELKMSGVINKYLDLCLKCSACSGFCPSGIDVTEIVALAKAEYFKLHKYEQLKSFVLKHVVFGFGLNLISRIRSILTKNKKTKKFTKKVIFFGGCGSKVFGNNDIITILNSLNIEVITPKFDCCGLPFYLNGDMNTFEEYIKKFYSELNKYDSYDIVTNCASCEKTLKSYEKWNSDIKINVINIFDLINESDIKPELSKNYKVTFHKPCNLNNWKIAESVLNNISNLEYIPMNEYDKCCGFNGVTKIKEYKTMLKLFKEKHNNILKTGAKIVLTSCLACKITLSLFSFGKYKVYDFAEFLTKNLK